MEPDEPLVHEGALEELVRIGAWTADRHLAALLNERDRALQAAMSEGVRSAAMRSVVEAASQAVAEALAVERATRSWTNASQFGQLNNAVHALRAALDQLDGAS